MSWAAAPVLAWAIWAGPVGGTCAAVVVAVADVVERGDLTQATANGIVLLLLAGSVVGYVVQLARRAEAAYAEAVHLRAAADERERLSRQIHDGVLQALADPGTHTPRRSRSSRSCWGPDPRNSAKIKELGPRQDLRMGS